MAATKGTIRADIQLLSGHMHPSEWKRSPPADGGTKRNDDSPAVLDEASTPTNAVR